MFEIINLTVDIEGKNVLRDVNLHISEYEAVVLFGPNGSGKTSLLKTVMGIPKYRVKSGRIIYKGKDITGIGIDERARLGIGMAFQNPPAIRGVKLKDILNVFIGKKGGMSEEKIKDSSCGLRLSDFLERDVNSGFSGGELKRSELLQLVAQNPDFIMFDEPDSGVDLVSISLVGRVINELLEKEKKENRRPKAGLIITHTGHILDYVKADKAYVILNGTISCSGNPAEILEDIRTKGYEGCVICRK